MFKTSKFVSFFLLTISISSCAILGKETADKRRKTNSFTVYTNVPGARIQVLNKPNKEYFGSTNTKSADGLYYSTNTFYKLRLGRTKLLVSKEGYISDTIKIHRVPRAEVVVCDLLFFNLLTPIDALCPDFYKISKKTKEHNVYLSPTQDFMKSKYMEIANKSDISSFDNFIKEYPNSDCIEAAKSRRDLIIKFNSELKENYSKAIATQNPKEMIEFFTKFSCEFSEKADLFYSESSSMLTMAKGQIFYNILSEISKYNSHSEQSKFIEETKTELTKSGLYFSNSLDFISTSISSCAGIGIPGSPRMFSGEIHLYAQKFAQSYFLEWVVNYHNRLTEAANGKYKLYVNELSEMENTISLISLSDKETILMDHGRLSKIDGFRDGVLLYTIWFSHDVNYKKQKEYKKIIEAINGKSRLDELTISSDKSDYGLRFHNIVVQSFSDLNSIVKENKELRLHLKSIHYFHPAYYTGGEISGLLKMNYVDGVNETIANWENEARNIREKGIYSSDWREIYDLSLELHGILKNLKIIELSHFGYDEKIPGIGGNNFNNFYESIEFWISELDNRSHQIAEGISESSKIQEKTANFCYADNYNIEKYELKLANFNNGEGKVVLTGIDVEFLKRQLQVIGKNSILALVMRPT